MEMEPALVLIQLFAQSLINATTTAPVTLQRERVVIQILLTVLLVTMVMDALYLKRVYLEFVQE